MSDRRVDAAEQKNQRDQAEGERDDAMESAVTRGPHGAEDSTRQQSVAEREPAEGAPDAGDS